MADHADIASDMLDHQLSVTLAKHKASQVQSVLSDCVDCGSEIPAARQAAMAGRGVIRCVSCQTDHELVSRTTRGRA